MTAKSVLLRPQVPQLPPLHFATPLYAYYGSNVNNSTVRLNFEQNYTKCSIETETQ